MDGHRHTPPARRPNSYRSNSSQYTHLSDNIPPNARAAGPLLSKQHGGLGFLALKLQPRKFSWSVYCRYSQDETYVAVPALHTTQHSLRCLAQSFALQLSIGHCTTAKRALPPQAMPKDKSKAPRDGSNSFSATFDGAEAGVSPVAVTLNGEPHLCASPGSMHRPTPTTAGVNGIGTKPERSHCLVIYTGGTFGMVPDENGVLHPSSGFLEKKISEMDEFKFENMPRVTVSEWANPIDSSDMTPDDWGTIAREIEAKYWDYDGFVVLQGTDTMAYTASALSFMLEYLGKPVVISGAMIPLHFPHSDARRNLIMSVMCAASLAIPEVCIYSNNKLLRGNRTTKVANMSVDAFHSPNFPSLAVTGVEATVDQPLILPYPRSRFRVFTELSTNICVFHLVPGFDQECIEAYIERHNANQDKSKRKALVFALYGTGNAPLRQDGFLRLVKMAIDAHIPVTITSQCVQGRTQLDSYATGVNLLNMGVITSLDMTIEACVAKLGYLMGKGFEGKVLKAKMETDLRGELSIVDAVANGEEMSRTRQYRKTVVRSFASSH